MNRLLSIAGESITAASLNNSTSARRKYLTLARKSLNSLDSSKLTGQEKSIHSMLKQKLQAIDPVSVPQLAGWEEISSKWWFLVPLLALILVFKK